MITLHQLGSAADATFRSACFSLSIQQLKIAKEYRVAETVRIHLRRIFGFQESLENPELEQFLSRAIFAIGDQLHRLQHQWTDLHNCSEQVN